VVKGFNEIAEFLLATGATLGASSPKKEDTKNTPIVQATEMSRDEALKGLKEIKELLDMGVLTQEEFDSKKQAYMKFI
ncbi:MAG: SHOCT domain-containing protein, partial [Aestuariibaculum sp.]